MARRTKGPRLYLKRAHSTRKAYWVIRDGEKRISTGCGPDDVEGARAALARHLAATHMPPPGARHPSQILIAEVLAVYRRERESKLVRPDMVRGAVPHLVEFWGDDYLSAIVGQRCEAYVEWRMAKGVSSRTARQNLEVLRAAIMYYNKRYGLDAVPVVTLPPKTEGRIRFLTRDEAARLLRASRRLGFHHLTRFILIGIYTGTRSQALLGLSWLPSTHTGWIDLDNEVIYRRGDDQKKTKKQQTPHTIPSRLMGHLRRWHRADMAVGARYVIHWQGERVTKLRRSWASARAVAGLGDDVVPHTLRHTAATWLMQLGVDFWDAAGYLGMTVETLTTVYGHHHPDFQKRLKNVF